MRGHGALIAAAVAAGMAMASPSGAHAAPTDPPAPPYTKDSFAFAEPAERSVRLAEVTDRQSRGTITLRLRNRTKLGGKLVLHYYPAAATGAKAEIVAPARLGPRDATQVQLRFTLPSGRPVTDLDGLLTARLASRGTFGPLARLRIRGAGPRITFAPEKLELTVDRYGPFDVGERSEVTVRGEDAPLLARLGQPIGGQVLRDGDATIRVAIGAPVLTDGVYIAPVTVSEVKWLDTGRFKGAVPVTSGRGEAALDVEVTVGFSFLVMAAVVLSGAILGGFAQRYSDVGRDARILRLRLLAAVDDYDAKVDERPGERPASYALDAFLDPRPPDKGAARYPGTRGVAGMQWHLATARTKRDVDDQRYRVRVVVRHVERWLTLEPVARAAADVLEQRPPRRGTVSMLQCSAFKDVRRLLDEAHTAPDASRPTPEDEEACRAQEQREDAEAAALVAALADQTAVLDLALEAWCYLSAFDRIADELEPQVHAEVLTCELAELEDRYPPLDQRDEATRQQLRLDLHDRVDRLAELWPEERHPRPRRDGGRLRAAQLERVVHDPSRTVASAPPAAHLGAGGGWRGVVLADWGWTLLAGLVSAIVYTLGAKAFAGGTWGGSLAEYASAFATGFAGEAIAWRRFPLFRGKRGDVEPEPPKETPAAEKPAPDKAAPETATPAPPERQEEPAVVGG